MSKEYLDSQQVINTTKTEEEKIKQIELLLIDIRDAYYGGYRTCADEDNIQSIEWGISKISKLKQLDIEDVEHGE